MCVLGGHKDSRLISYSRRSHTVPVYLRVIPVSDLSSAVIRPTFDHSLFPTPITRYSDYNTLQRVSFAMPKHSTSCSAPSGLSASEIYQPPDANHLAALLAKDKPARPHEVEFNSRESTPFIMEIPPGADHWKSVAGAARGKLEKLLGKPAADEIRHSIPYMHYWKTEARHYAEYWDLVTGKLSNKSDCLHSVTTDDVRT